MVVLESGSERGPALVLLHGFPLNAHMWAPQLEAPPAGWRIIAPHLRGFGPTPARSTIDDEASLDDYAADVEALLDDRRIDRAVVGGLSMGGYAAFALYRLAPHRFGGLILADTRPQADSEEARAGRRRLIDAATTRGPSAVADEMLPKLLAPANVGGEIERRVRTMAESNTAEGLTGALVRMMRRPDSTPLLCEITCPTLIIVGSEDRLTPPEVAREMQRQIPNARLEIIDGAGHLPNLEQPSAFNNAISQFLLSI